MEKERKSNHPAKSNLCTPYYYVHKHKHIVGQGVNGLNSRDSLAVKMTQIGSSIQSANPILKIPIVGMS